MHHPPRMLNLAHLEGDGPLPVIREEIVPRNRRNSRRYSDSYEMPRVHLSDDIPIPDSEFNQDSLNNARFNNSGKFVHL